MKELVNRLKELKTNCIRTADDIQSLLDKIEADLKIKMEQKSAEMKRLAKEIKAAKCSIVAAIFSLGIACAIEANRRA